LRPDGQGGSRGDGWRDGRDLA